MMKTPEYQPPSRIYVDVTNACPLRCLHCCSRSGDSYENELTLAEIKDIIDQVQEMSVHSLVLSGGEPMLRADLFDMLEHARTRGLGVTLLTSGIMIDRWTARALGDLHIRVKISLDGVRAETHDFLRGRGSFEKALQALTLLREEGVKERSIHFTTHTKNMDELPALADFLPAAGIQNLVVGTIKPSGRAKEHESLLLPPALYPYFKQKVSELAQRGTVVIQSFVDRDWEGFGCPATCNKFGLTASGTATTCVFFGNELQGGNIREFSLRELWEQYRAGTALFAANSHCRECPVLPVMGGGCRARAMHYCGDRNGRDPYCCALYEKKLFLDSYRYICEEALQGEEYAFL
jgi:radical SAM protein with 4Fe4S-binding SPASM domain